jgi:peptide subunit release factor 1 (eRF1)
VQTLVVDAELRRPCRRCDACGALTQVEDRCPICGSQALHTCADLADEAIEDALAHGGQAEVIGEHAEFRRDGGMGGLLRFRPDKGRREAESTGWGHLQSG